MNIPHQSGSPPRAEMEQYRTMIAAHLQELLDAPSFTEPLHRLVHAQVALQLQEFTQELQKTAGEIIVESQLRARADQASHVALGRELFSIRTRLEEISKEFQEAF